MSVLFINQKTIFPGFQFSRIHFSFLDPGKKRDQEEGIFIPLTYSLLIFVVLFVS